MVIRSKVKKNQTDASELPYQLTKDGKALKKWWLPMSKVVIPDGVERISSKAFSEKVSSAIRTLVIPDSVKDVPDYTFASFRNLEEVDCPENINPGAFFGLDIVKEFADEDSFLMHGSVLKRYYGKDKKVVIPDRVTSIGWYAFSDCTNLTSITIPSSVTSIERGAFYKCKSLTSITIPNSVTSIGDVAFSDCRGLTSVMIGSSVTSIGSWAFDDCTGLTSITIPDSVTSIERGAFYNCSSLTSITIPNSVTSIGFRAFDGCTKLNKVKYLGQGNMLDNVEIGEHNEDLIDAYKASNNISDDADQEGEESEGLVTV